MFSTGFSEVCRGWRFGRGGVCHVFGGFEREDEATSQVFVFWGYERKGDIPVSACSV